MKERTPVICDRCKKRGYLGEDDFRALAPILDFTPVPRQCERHDGWTPERQRAFIEALAASGSVRQAAAAVNMSPEGAYHLRRQPGAGEFRRAWSAALDYGVRILADNALDRAINGVPVPIMYQGKQVAERRVFNERLTMWTLQHRMAETFPGAPQVARGTKAPDTLAREAADMAASVDQGEAHDFFWSIIARAFDTAFVAGRVFERAAAAGDDKARRDLGAQLSHFADAARRGDAGGIDFSTMFLRIGLSLSPYGDDLVEAIERDEAELPTYRDEDGGAEEDDGEDQDGEDGQG